MRKVWGWFHGSAQGRLAYAGQWEVGRNPTQRAPLCLLGSGQCHRRIRAAGWTALPQGHLFCGLILSGLQVPHTKRMFTGFKEAMRTKTLCKQPKSDRNVSGYFFNGES